MRVLMSLIVSILLAACSTAPTFPVEQSAANFSPGADVSGYAVGEKVPYARGKNFHIEQMAFFRTTETAAVLAQERANVRYPVSYAYPVNSRIRKGRNGYEFAVCDLRANVTIYGLTSPSTVGELDVLQTGDVKIGTVRPDEVGPNYVRFNNMNVDQVRTIVLPYQFVNDGSRAHRPVYHLEALNFTPQGPFAVGQEVMYDMTHRVFPNPKRGQEGRINVGMLMPIEVDPGARVCRTQVAFKG